MRACRTVVLTGIVLGCLPLVGLGQTQLIRIPTPSKPAPWRQLVAAPRDFVELCTDVKAHSALSWQFEAEHPVGFNTHFHQKGAVKLPESMTAISAAKGRLVPSGDHDFCWMWTNPTSEPVVIRMGFGP